MTDLEIKCHNCGAPYKSDYCKKLSSPISANDYWPNTFILWWINECCDAISHTEAVASFGERISNRIENEENAQKASSEFNSLPTQEKTIDKAREIVKKYDGTFSFDLWLKRFPKPKPKKLPFESAVRHKRAI